MKRLLNTLYVTTPDTYLFHEGKTVIAKLNREVRLKVPIHTLSSIVATDLVTLSPSLMNLCTTTGVSISFLNMHGRFLARVEGPISGNVLLRREQYRRVDIPEQRVAVARAVIMAKIANGRAVLQRTARDHSEKVDREALETAASALGRLISRVESETNIDTLRGREGEAAAVYFGSFDHLIVSRKQDFSFQGRSRRPPLDNVNALLSFIYALMVHDIRSALECVGLDPQVGFLHTERPGRASLALDLMEEFRPVIADRLALTLINLGQVRGKGFRKSESGAVEMNDETRKTLLTAYQKRKQDEVLHPYLGEKIPIGMLYYAQALLLARHLRGDIDGYPPFFWK